MQKIKDILKNTFSEHSSKISSLNTLSSNTYFTDWFAKNCDSVNFESVLGIAVFILIRYLNMITPLNFVVHEFFNINVYWSEVILFHGIALIFVAIFIVRQTFELRSLKKRPDELLYFEAYLNGNVSDRIVMPKAIKPSPIKHKLMFIFFGLSFAALFMAFDWFQYIRAGNETSFLKSMSVIEAACYLFFIIRLSFYLLVYREIQILKQ